MDATKEYGLYHPRVEEALTITKCAHVGAVRFSRRLRVFRPRNIRDMEAPWSCVSVLLGMEPSLDEDDDMKQRKEKVDASQWKRIHR